MKLLNRYISRKYLQRLLLSFMTLITFVLGVFAMTMYWQMKETTARIQTEANRKVLGQVKYNVEYMDEILKNLMMALFFDNEVISMLDARTLDYADVSTKLAKLDKTAASSTYLHSILLYNGFTDTYLSTDRKIQDNLKGQIERYREQIKDVDALPKLTMVPIRITDDSRTAVDFFSYGLYEQQGRPFERTSKLILNVKPSWLFNNIKAINNLAYEHDSELFIVDGAGRVYTQDNRPAERRPAALMSRIASSGNAFEGFAYGSGRDKLFVNVMSLGVYGWKAVTLQSYDTAFGQLQYIRNVILVSALLFSLLAVLLAVLLSQRLYRPVDRMMRQLGGESEGARFAQRDEWTYLSGMYASMRDKMTAAERHASRNRQIVTHYHVRRLLAGSAGFGTADFARELETCRIPLRPEGPFVVGIVAIDDYKRFRARWSEAEQGLYRFALANIAEETLGALGDAIVLPSGEDRWLFVIGARPGRAGEAAGQTEQEEMAGGRIRETGLSETFETAPETAGAAKSEETDATVGVVEAEEKTEAVKAIEAAGAAEVAASLRQIQQLLRQYYGLGVSVAWVPRVSDHSGLGLALEEAERLVPYRLFLGQEALITPAAANEQGRREELHQAAALERDIMEQLRGGHTDALLERIDAFFAYAGTLTYDQCMNAILHLSVTLAGAVQDMNLNRVQPIELNVRAFYSEVLEQETLASIRVAFRSLANRISDQARRGSVDKTAILCQTIKEIIAENGSDPDFSQQTVADLLKMSSAYLGRVFKQETGMAITEHLNEIRLGKSLELLEHGDMTVNEVMEQSGYRSQSYFFKLFKQRYGTTPKDYRLKRGLSADGDGAAAGSRRGS